MRAIWMAMTAAALMGAAVMAGGPGGPGEVRAKVPFDFVVADQVFPAGVYTIAPFGAASVLRIQSADQLRGVTVVSTMGTRNRTGHWGALAFHRYGTQYFLTEIWTTLDGSGSQVPECKAEKALKGKPVTEYTVVTALLEPRQ